MRYLALAGFILLFLLLAGLRAPAQTKPDPTNPIITFGGQVLRVHLTDKGAYVLTVAKPDGTEAVAYLDPTQDITIPHPGDTIQVQGHQLGDLIVANRNGIQEEVQHVGQHTLVGNLTISRNTNSWGAIAQLYDIDGQYVDDVVLNDDSYTQWLRLHQEHYDGPYKLYGYRAPSGVFVIEELLRIQQDDD